MYLFDHTVTTLDEWAEIFQNVAAFEPLVRHILDLHGLPQTSIENTTPGSHAVFRCGDYLVKIFAPDTFGWDCESDFVTETVTMRRANRLGIAVPELAAHGRIDDRYHVRYLIERFIDGTEFGKKELSSDDKVNVGKQLRGICDKMNVPCERFNDYDFLEGALTCPKWDIFPESFRRERTEFLRNRSHGGAVYVHGDIHADNVIFGNDGKVWILDFADSVLAPVEYEYAALFPGLFRMETPYLDGFFGTWEPETIADMLTYGLCLHKFGVNILAEMTEDVSGIDSIAALQRLLIQVIERSRRPSSR